MDRFLNIPAFKLLRPYIVKICYEDIGKLVIAKVKKLSHLNDFVTKSTCSYWLDISDTPYSQIVNIFMLGCNFSLLFSTVSPKFYILLTFQ